MPTPQYNPNVNIKFRKTLLNLVIALIIIAFASFSLGFNENNLLMREKFIKITGPYGEKIPVNEINSIELTSRRPSLSRKMFGTSTGNRLKGYFATGKGEKIKVIINSNITPWILITKKSDEKIYYSSNRKSNKDIYKLLQRKYPELSTVD